MNLDEALAKCSCDLKETQRLRALSISGRMTQVDIAKLLTAYSPRGYATVSPNTDAFDLRTIARTVVEIFNERNIPAFNVNRALTTYIRSFCQSIDVFFLFKWKVVVPHNKEKAPFNTTCQPGARLSSLFREQRVALRVVLPTSEEESLAFDKVISSLRDVSTGAVFHDSSEATVTDLINSVIDMGSAIAEWLKQSPLMLVNARQAYAIEFMTKWWSQATQFQKYGLEWGSGYRETCEILTLYGTPNIFYIIKWLHDRIDDRRVWGHKPIDIKGAANNEVIQSISVFRLLNGQALRDFGTILRQNLNEQIFNPSPKIMLRTASYFGSYAEFVARWWHYLVKYGKKKPKEEVTMDLVNQIAELRQESCRLMNL
jgi:hypothetical protein